MQSNQSQKIKSACVMRLKNGSSFIKPTAWRAERLCDCIHVISPENDFSIYFMELAGEYFTTEEINQAWQKIVPQFNLKSLRESSSPITDDWEKIIQVTYDTPASEMRVVVGIVRIFKGMSYLCLIDAKITGLSRRASEFNIMIESWKPVGFRQTAMNPDLAREWARSDIQDFEKFFSIYMKEFQIPGAAVAVVLRSGKTLYSGAFGVKCIETNEPVTIDTPFMIGSTTKSLTTLMMAMLIDQNKLTWETNVIELLKNFSLADSDLSNKMQIRHTVSASTGIPRQDLSLILNYKGMTPEKRIQQMQQMKPTTEFGKTFQYSNQLVMVGGHAAASTFAPQLDLENAYLLSMQKLVFEPLKMKKTVIKPSRALQLGAAFPHALDVNGKISSLPFEVEEACYSFAPASAIWSTVLDLSNYILLEMNNGMFADKRLVSSESILERRKPGIKMGENAWYGLGLRIANEQGFHFIGHDGNTLGFSSHLFFLPEKGIGMCILANLAFAHSFFSAIKQKFLEITFSVKSRAEEIAQFGLQEKEQFIKNNIKSISYDPKDMKALDYLLGEYVSLTLGEANFAKSDEKYTIEFEGFTTEVGIETDAAGKKLLVLTSPPWSGTFKLRIGQNNENLILNFGQEEHHFYPKRL